MPLNPKKRPVPEWRRFEELVARIEADAGPLGLVVTSPDRVRCRITGRLREVDASVRMKVGTADVLVTIECRRRGHRQDVTWIEQLATKKQAIGATHTIAVSASGFSREAIASAEHHGIDLRELSEVSAADINNLMRLNFVLFNHKRCAAVRVALRPFRTEAWTVPDPTAAELLLLDASDPCAPVFRNIETETEWGLNDLWLQLQEATDPFASIDRGSEAVVRTCCFSYPGNVVVTTSNGKVRLGDVLVDFRLWIDVEQVDIKDARTVEYKARSGEILQRVEFESCEPTSGGWRISLQIPKNSTDSTQVRIRSDLPKRHQTDG